MSSWSVEGRRNRPVNAIELREVRAGYGRIEVLHDVDIAVPPASVVALLGPNGAGKSTALKIASGRMLPTRGCVHIAGYHVNGARPSAIAAAGVCSIPEGRGVFPNLTVDENLRIMTYCGVSFDAIATPTYTRFPKLEQRRRQLAGTLSGGEQQMLAMARALTTDPRVLLLDEISAGLAPLVVGELFELVGELADNGIAILLVEQFAHTALAVADVAIVMTRGTIKAVGDPDDIREVISDAYLGGAA
jgi:branched-chain amino acid transport system ATP-binding protein